MSGPGRCTADRCRVRQSQQQAAPTGGHPVPTARRHAAAVEPPPTVAEPHPNRCENCPALFVFGQSFGAAPPRSSPPGQVWEYAWRSLRFRSMRPTPSVPPFAAGGASRAVSAAVPPGPRPVLRRDCRCRCRLRTAESHPSLEALFPCCFSSSCRFHSRFKQPPRRSHGSGTAAADPVCRLVPHPPACTCVAATLERPAPGNTG